MKYNPDASLDKDARYGYKTRKKPFFGYKAHASMDSDSELVTGLESTPGNANDGNEFPRVVNSKANTVTADKAYDSKQNHRSLKRKRSTSTIVTKKKIGEAAA